jgi:hypothetical protein
MNKTSYTKFRPKSVPGMPSLKKVPKVKEKKKILPLNKSQLMER